VTAGSVGELAQRALPGEHSQPVHRGPDGVLDAIAALPVEHAGVGQFVEDRAELIQGRGVLPGPDAGSEVGVLVRQGERDFQVRMADFECWKKPLGNQPTASFKTYPALNHLFTPGNGRASNAEYFQPNHVPEEVIQDIAGWVKKNSH